MWSATIERNNESSGTQMTYLVKFIGYTHQVSHGVRGEALTWHTMFRTNLHGSSKFRTCFLILWFKYPNGITCQIQRQSMYFTRLFNIKLLHSKGTKVTKLLLDQNLSLTRHSCITPPVTLRSYSTQLHSVLPKQYEYNYFFIQKHSKSLTSHIYHRENKV